MKLKMIFAVALATLTVPAFALAQYDDSILVDDYIISQEFIEAEVTRVRAQARTITVRGEKRGQTRTFTVPEGARITVNGRDARLRDIRKGDSVLFAMKPKSEKVVISQLRVPATARTLEQRRAETSVAEVMPASLPKTASFLPAILVLGLFSLAGAALTRRFRA